MECILYESLRNTGIFAHLRLHSRIYTRNILQFPVLQQILLPHRIPLKLLPNVLTFYGEDREVSVDSGVAQELLGNFNGISPEGEGRCFQLYLL